MQKKVKTKRFLAFLMSLMMLMALLPTAAFTESDDMPGEAEVVLDQSIDDGALSDVLDVSDETEQVIPSEDEPSADLDATYEEQNDPATQSIESMIAANGSTYVVAAHSVTVYGATEMAEPVFTITQDNAVLLAIEYTAQGSVKVWFLNEENEVIAGYVAADVLGILMDEEAAAMTGDLWSGLISTDAGELYAFVVKGERPVTASDDPVMEAEETNEPTETEESAQELPTANVGDYVAVTPKTRAFLGIDETASNEYVGDVSLGVFVKDATVQVTAIEQDGFGRYWFMVRYLYGDDFADGTMKWTEDGFLYVLASETGETAEQECSVTDYAFSSPPAKVRMGLLAATPMNGFTLKTISAPIPSLSAGQTGVYGSSGKDSDYKQIATAPSHGTVYATPHYLNGFTVYCLEHNLPGPGENISGGGQQPTGPYVIVDIDTYRNTPGYSSIIYHESTLHAIAWVLRHTYPFMALDRNDADNITWSRVAGQFAIRQVIRQMEGAQYVRSYWNMDNFYVASGQAPSVYLTYARWLATNGIARGQITGNITITGKSVIYSGGMYTGTVTLSTDADLIRIRKTVGTVTGNSAGSDGTYFYLKSGDTITVSSGSNPFTITAESISSADEEASFLVGVPSASIQKVLIPQYGYPYKLKSASITFEIPLGSISVTKKDAKNGSVLPGAVFELLNSTGIVVQTATTGSNGITTFSSLQPGAYSVREKTAPEGYYVATPNTQNVTVTSGSPTRIPVENSNSRIVICLRRQNFLNKEVACSRCL